MNTTYRFEWSQIVVDPFMAQLSAVTEIPSERRAEVTALLARIFEGVGGSPYADSDWDVEHRTRVAGRLLGEAVRAVLKHRFGFQSPKSGVVAEDDDGDVVAVELETVDVNRASLAQLEALPVLGKVLAGRIEEERRHNGYFYSMSDLVERVKGLGDTAEERLAGVLDFGDQGAPKGPTLSGVLEGDLQAILSLGFYESGRDRLVAALEEVALFVAAHPHPYTLLSMKREDLEPDVLTDEVAAGTRASRIQVLVDRGYYGHVVRLLESAHDRIDVCMFYIALPIPEHPTHKLLEALARKAASGTTVRVLVDQDGKDDPYKSRRINARAVAYLSSHGVEVKGDSTERLLHSKFVVVDDETVVIGSHNWTAGSFFHYADVSVVISGSQASGLWRTRFDRLWSDAEDFKPSDPEAETL